MATTAPTSSSEIERRRLRDTVTTGLTEPLAEILRTLQRLALNRLDPGTSTLDAHLLERARSLAHGLQQVVEELVADGTQSGVLEGREPQETLLVATALDAAAATAAPQLADRNVVVRCALHAAVVSNAVRLHELLVTLLEVAAVASVGDIRVSAERRRGELIVAIDGVRLPADALDRVRKLARSLGGSVQGTTDEHEPGVCVWLPQQRAGDTLDGAR
jgi:light-regulated signal transduction histidine kinase (bacteriophytochrome)